jgi:hypothetical protein
LRDVKDVVHRIALCVCSLPIRPCVSDFFLKRSVGTVTNGYLHSAIYRVKPEAPPQTLEELSKSMVFLLLTETSGRGLDQCLPGCDGGYPYGNPGLFYVFYICLKADGLDKVNAALMLLQSGPM